MQLKQKIDSPFVYMSLATKKILVNIVILALVLVSGLAMFVLKNV